MKYSLLRTRFCCEVHGAMACVQLTAISSCFEFCPFACATRSRTELRGSCAACFDRRRGGNPWYPDHDGADAVTSSLLRFKRLSWSRRTCSVIRQRVAVSIKSNVQNVPCRLPFQAVMICGDHGCGVHAARFSSESHSVSPDVFHTTHLYELGQLRC